MIDTFLSGGCSFSEVPTMGAENWPLHVEKYLQVPSIHTGLSTAGNYFIYKSLIYELSKIENKENVLVGIMWSGANRGMFYTTKEIISPEERKSIKTMFPVKIAGEKAYYFTQPYLKRLNYNKIWYSNFHDIIASYIQTVEYILQLQWYLKLNSIKYFMTTFSGYSLPDHDNLQKHPDISYLYNQIDFSNWLDVKSMMDFNKESGLPFKAPNDLHPSTEQSKLFTEQVIIPHLKKVGYVE